MKSLRVRGNQGCPDFNTGAQAQFTNIANIRLGHDKLKIWLRSTTIPSPAPNLDTGKIGYALVGKEIDVIELV